MSSPKYKTYSDDRGKTLLHIEWTNQHGCGGDEDKDPHKLNCNIVLQYMCQLDDKYPSNSKDRLRDGTSTNRQDYQRGSGNDAQREKESQNTANGRKNRNVRTDRGYQESWEWYDKCRNRQRNKGESVILC